MQIIATLNIAECPEMVQKLSAPRLQDLWLFISRSPKQKLLSLTTFLWEIPDSGYIPPDARLETRALLSRPEPESQRPSSAHMPSSHSPPTHVQRRSEDIIAQIDAPLLKYLRSSWTSFLMYHNSTDWS